MIGLFVKLKSRVGVALLALFAMVVSSGAFAQAEDFEGITTAEIQSVYTGVLNLIGTWVGVLMGILAVVVGTMWVVNRLRGGSGIK